MKPVALGASYRGEVIVGPRDLASALGNAGVEVVSSPAIIGHLEMACHHVMHPHFETGEASVGVGFSMRHMAAAFPDQPLEVAAELMARNGKRFTFRVEARQDGRVIMTGEHERALVHLDRFLEPRPSPG